MGRICVRGVKREVKIDTLLTLKYNFSNQSIKTTHYIQLLIGHVTIM